jgi:DNA-nicking Smr family endonuclease
MQSIRSWLEGASPAAAQELRETNPSYVFFREVADIPDPALGPIGSQGAQLTEGRSLAVDRRFHALGAPVWVSIASRRGTHDRPRADERRLAPGDGARSRRSMKRRRGLSPGEDALWRKATSSVRPLRKGPRESAPPLQLGETSKEEVAPVRSRARVASPPAKAASKRAGPSRFASGDPALDRKARRGRIEIERMLDLHGLREAAALTRLRSFLDGASRDGCRCVLVITGKGTSASGADAAGEERPRGVIRKRFQEWIEEEPLRSLITRAAPAQPKDGGSGAFYVFLKKRR